MACSTTKQYDYSIYPQGAVFSSSLKNKDNSFYLIKDDSLKMSGNCFFYNNNQALVDLIHFSTDSTGTTDFQIIGGNIFTGKLVINKQNDLVLSIPDVQALGIKSQKIVLKKERIIRNFPVSVERYKEPLFENILSKQNVQYGTAPGYYTSKPIDYVKNDDYVTVFLEILKSYKSIITKEVPKLIKKAFKFFPKLDIKNEEKDLPLYLDIYQPENDIVKKRPLLLFVHGGSFFFGDKENKIQQSITEEFVKRGYVVASINYRLGSTLLGISAIERTIYNGVQDTRAALRYLVFHKDAFGIDEKQIYLVGSSAGSIISMTTAFMDDNEVFSFTDEGLLHLRKDLGGLDGSGNNIKNPFQIAGVVSLWGAVTDLKIINNNIPTLLFHGTDDNIVPCDEGLPFKNDMGEAINRFISSVLKLKLYGSIPIHQKMTNLGFSSKYIPFHHFGHEACANLDGSLNKNMDIIKAEMNEFLYSNISKKYFNYSIKGDVEINKTSSISIYKIENAHKNTSIEWQIDNGFIIEQSNASVRAVWYNTSNKGNIIAHITNTDGASCKKELEVRINCSEFDTVVCE